MIAANTLMVIGGLVLIEGVRREVQHTVVKTLIVQDLLVGLRHLLRRLTLTLRHEHLVVEVTLVDMPQVTETEQQEDRNRIRLLQLTITERQQHARTHQDDIERT